MTRRVLLVRHPPVDDRFAGVCYGVSDVPLGAAGRAAADALVRVLAAEPVTHLFHSGLARTAAVADRLAARSGIPAVPDPRLRERDFGTWELRRWDDIYAETGAEMDRMLTDPAGWAPPRGETTFGLRDRVLGWHSGLPATGVIVAVTHGGPIAALRGTIAGVPVPGWPKLVPPQGGVIELATDQRTSIG